MITFYCTHPVFDLAPRVFPGVKIERGLCERGWAASGYFTKTSFGNEDVYGLISFSETGCRYRLQLNI